VNQKIIISLALTAALPILVGAIAQGAQPASAILPGDAAVTMKFAQHHRSLALWESNRVDCQLLAAQRAGFQDVWFFTMALRIVSSLRMQATIATLCSLPAPVRRW
jgi:hypothetical protein